MMEVGEYEATVTGQAMTTTKNGHPQIEIVCSLKDFLDDNGNPLTRTVYMVLTDKTVKYVADDLERVFGYVPEKWSHLSPDSPSFVKLLGDVMLYCKHDEYDGKLKEKWSFSDPTRGMRPAPAPEQLMTLDAMFGAALAGKKKAPKAAAAPKAEPATTAPKGNDDIPF